MEKAQVLKVSEVGEILGVSRVTVWRLLRDGYLKGYQVTPYPRSPWVVFVESVEEYMQKREGRVE